MARSLEELKRQYHSIQKHGAPKMGGGPRGGGPRGMGGGKPKNTKKTIGRLLGYIGKYKILLLVVLIFMMINTAMSLIGGYMTRPIINRLAEYVGLEADPETLNSPIYIMLDSAIESVKNSATGFIASIVGDAYNATATEESLPT